MMFIGELFYNFYAKYFPNVARAAARPDPAAALPQGRPRRSCRACGSCTSTRRSSSCRVGPAYAASSRAAAVLLRARRSRGRRGRSRPRRPCSRGRRSTLEAPDDGTIVDGARPAKATRSKRARSSPFSRARPSRRRSPGASVGARGAAKRRSAGSARPPTLPGSSTPRTAGRRPRCSCARDEGPARRGCRSRSPISGTDADAAHAGPVRPLRAGRSRSSRGSATARR